MEETTIQEIIGAVAVLGLMIAGLCYIIRTICNTVVRIKKPKNDEQ